MRNSLIRLVICFAALFAGAASAAEQPSFIDQFNARLDRAHATLEEIEKALAEPSLSDGTLKHLRDKNAPILVDLQDIIDKLTPHLHALEARLKELGPPSTETKPPAEEKERDAKPGAPKPEEAKPAAKPPDAEVGKTPPVNPVDGDSAAAARVNAEWAEQRKLYDDVDATLKRARSLLLQAQQTGLSIRAHQRALFAKIVFLRTNGLFAPSLWNAALRELPADVKTLQDIFRERAANFAKRLENGQGVEFLGLVLAIAMALASATFLARRVRVRRETIAQPTRFQQAVGAAWVALATAAIPIAAVSALALAIDNFDLLDASLEPLQKTIVEAAARIALAYALARALLSPKLAQWRLIDVGTHLARRLTRLAVALAVIVSATRIIEQLEEIVQAGLPMVIVTRGLGTLFVAGLVALVLLSSARRFDDEDRVQRAARDWSGPLRLLALATIAVIVGACATGFVTFASFVVTEAGWIATVGAILYLLLLLAETGLEKTLEPAAPLGRGLMSGLGVRRESLGQFAVLLSGLITLAAYALATFLVLVPLGVQSGDFIANLQTAFVSFKIGDVTISLSSIVTAAALFAAVLAATRGLRRWLDLRYLPLTRLDMGLRNSIGTSLGYAGFILAVSLALAQLGLSLEKLAIVVGALSVGIGFGLQSIVNNFVSGLILLWERAIRVGDWVVVGDEQGYVKRINVRSTEIETFDRATMIVPNSNLVSGVVKNWLRNDRVGRIKIALAPHAGVDPEQVRAILLAVARAQEGVLRIPAPQVMFLAMEASSFRFELWCFVEDVEQSTRVRSDLHFNLHKRLAEAGVTIAPALAPPPATIVQLSGLEKFVAASRDAAEQ